MNQIKIKSVRKIKNRSKRYDLETDTHNFFANNILVHNSSSSFYFHDGHFGVCGRNWEYKVEAPCVYTDIARKYNLQEKLTNLGKALAIQGEIIGPKINGGHTGINENKLTVFDVYDIANHRFLAFDQMVMLCVELGLTHVPILENGDSFHYDIPTLKILCNRNYEGTNLPIEGIVIRPITPMTSNVLDGRLSFKVINEEFLLKYGE